MTLNHHFIIKSLIAFAFIWLGKNYTAQQRQFQVYSVEEGLPQSQIYAMVIDHNHRIWLGTKGGGLCFFDGKRFKLFKNNDEFTEDKIFSLYEDTDETLWIGTSNGLYSFDGIHFKREEFSNTSYQTAISSILQDDDGVLWLAASNGLFYKKNGQWVSYSAQFKTLKYNVACLYKSPKGQIWAGSDAGLFKILANGYQQITTKDGLTSNKLRSINEVNGKMLVGTYGGGLNVLIKDKWKLLGAADEIVNHILVDEKNEVWLSTQNSGVVHINHSNNLSENIKTEQGLSTNHVRLICTDPWKNKWIATSGGGLNKLYQPIFEHYDEKDGHEGNMFYALETGKGNSIWTSTNANGINKIIGDSIAKFKLHPKLKNIKCKALFEDRRGLLWIGSEGEGVFVFDGNSFVQINGDLGLSDNWVKEITQDSQGNIWCATVSGISKISYQYADSSLSINSIKDFSKYKGLPDERINCIKADGEDRIWFGTQSGYVGYILQNEVFYSEEDHKKIKSAVKSISIDGLNRLWIATEGNGVLFSTLTDEFITFNGFGTSDGLNNANVYLIKADAQNHIWAGAGSGIDEIVVSDKNELLYIKHYGKNEGFLGGETCSNSVTIDNLGKMWIGTLDGLNCFESDHNFKNLVAPKIYFEDITIFYQSIKNSLYSSHIEQWMESIDDLTLDYTDNHLSFSFNAINLLNPDKIQFKYKLEGFDKDWSPVGIRKEATYSNLSPGAYVFTVQAVNEDGIWSEEKSISFSIETPFWKTWWFYTILIIALSLIITLIIWTRVQSFKRKNQEEKEKLKIERNLLELEQKALRLQMNPHFIFNAMNTVQALIAKNDTKEARYYLAKFSKLMRKILENSRHALISIQDEVEALDNYLNLEKLSGNHSFEYSITIDPTIQPDAFGIPPLLLQPFAENAIVHGLKEIEHTGKIDIRFDLQEDHIVCVVEDNGRGRMAAKEVRQQKSSYHKSTALLITQERLSALAEEVSYTPFEIIDKSNPTGTLVIVRIPVVEIY
ncbi:MAG: ligand-binding sensor domain-containing protein [Flavobacteriales bacterium]|jgi:ligand-binding sensor domain-containing protein